jgi:hypothetical protein
MEMNILKPILSILGLFVFLVISFLLAGVLTGKDKRSYSVLLPGAIEVVNGQSITAENLAARYQPKMYVRDVNETPALLWTWYEVVPDANSIDIVYYQNWENEINPDPILYKLYATFRAAYYGYPLYDIEFIQVRIDKATGKIIGLLFETSPEDNFYVTISEHLVARYKLESGGQFIKFLEKRSGDFISESVDHVMFDGEHALFLVQTWNHLSRLLTLSDNGIHYIGSDIKFLSEENYSKYKFVRKSQSDHKTSPNNLTLIFGTICIYGLLTIPVILIRLFKRKKLNPQKPG